jgi:peptidoglycan/xylan/chitin deacetylase (PgdA/CDA1 family)
MNRDLVGYGRTPPAVKWPNDARLAVSIVVNYEEGSERNFAMGDPDQESMTEFGSYPMPSDIRNLAMESMYEYGSRVGVWRVLDLLKTMRAPATFYACAVAFEHTPDVARAIITDGHEVCSHGYRWEETFRLTEAEEREHIRLAVESFKKTCGFRPSGWYCRYGPSDRTRRLVVEEGGFLYDSDSYNDDTPFYVKVGAKHQLVLPYAPDINDIKFWVSPGFITKDQFASYMKDSLDTLYAESARFPRMMSIGLHPRIIGRPGRLGSLRYFIAYAQSFPDVWFATREQIARWWIDHGPKPGAQ